VCVFRFRVYIDKPTIGFLLSDPLGKPGQPHLTLWPSSRVSPLTTRKLVRLKNRANLKKRIFFARLELNPSGAIQHCGKDSKT
jgi:hypothetical protein